MNPDAPQKHRIDKWIPWMFVLFFVVIAAVDGIMVTIAVKTQPGVVTDNAYEEGLAYNKVLDAAQKQADLGWKSQIENKNGRLLFTLKDKNGLPVSGGEAQAHIVRPVQDGYDFDVPLTELEKGLYGADVRFPLRGEWDARVFVKWQDKHYQSSRVLVVD